MRLSFDSTMNGKMSLWPQVADRKYLIILFAICFPVWDTVVYQGWQNIFQVGGGGGGGRLTSDLTEVGGGGELKRLFS